MKCQHRVSKNQESYRLIVMDINMPGLDGVETTGEIRKFMDPYIKQRR
jgi:CheY-like chemotaxis protein